MWAKEGRGGAGGSGTLLESGSSMGRKRRLTGGARLAVRVRGREWSGLGWGEGGPAGGFLGRGIGPQGEEKEGEGERDLGRFLGWAEREREKSLWTKKIQFDSNSGNSNSS